MAMLENDDDKEAYDSLTNRPPNEDLSLEGQAEAALSDDGDMTAAPPPAPPSLRQSVMDRISQNISPNPKDPLAGTPEMQAFDKRQAALLDFRKAQMQANAQNNLGQALSQAAQGANTPVQDNSLFKNIEDQNKVLSRGAEQDEDRRARVANQIENRLSRQDSTKIRDQYLASAATNKADQKKASSQDSAYSKLIAQAQTARGAPAVSQAEKDLYASQKADSLASLYGDPNKLSQAQSQLLSSEIAKMATGGVPSIHELEGLTPGTINGKLSVWASKLINKPTPANAGAFIKQYQDYAHALTKDARGVIKSNYGRLGDAYKSQISPEQFDSFDKTYVNRFAPMEEAEKASAPSKAGQIVNYQGKTYRVGDDGDTLNEVIP